MSEPRKLTVTLQWRSQDGLRTQAFTCNDQPPHKLIPTLVQQLALTSAMTSATRLCTGCISTLNRGRHYTQGNS